MICDKSVNGCICEGGIHIMYYDQIKNIAWWVGRWCNMLCAVVRVYSMIE